MTDYRHKSKHQPRIYAHRGTTLLAPENTQPAFDLALEHGADVLETDVRLSADGHVIVTHDADVKRTTDGNGQVRGLTLAALKELDAGYRARSLDQQTFAGQGIELITLDELFELYPDVAVNIDIKDKQPEAAQAVADCINRHQRQHNTTVGSFHSALLLDFRRYAPAIRTAAVRHEVVRLYFSRLALPRGGIGTLTKRSGDDQTDSGGRETARSEFSALQIPVRYKMIPLATRRFIERISAQGLEICYWTINDPAQMRQLLLRGAHGIVTDRPDLAETVFRELGLRG
ncbi:MAG: glycerophosphodiester phosphodiesterase [Gammaproteobacteria bacterium]|nr:glycerophosphodiester phosphodiesterase [Gammaproteobacteria bacterium]